MSELRKLCSAPCIGFSTHQLRCRTATAFVCKCHESGSALFVPAMGLAAALAWLVDQEGVWHPTVSLLD